MTKDDIERIRKECRDELTAARLEYEAAIKEHLDKYSKKQRQVGEKLRTAEAAYREEQKKQSGGLRVGRFI